MTPANRAILIQAVFISVVAVVAGKLTDRAWPGFRASGVVGAVIGGLVSGGLAVWFDRKSKAKATSSSASVPVKHKSL